MYPKYYVDYSSRIESGSLAPQSIAYPWVITVPLDFWFTKNPGLSLPLIALQYHEVELEIPDNARIKWYLEGEGNIYYAPELVVNKDEINFDKLSNISINHYNRSV